MSRTFAPTSKPRRRLISHETLRQKMSELISLREQVAQAELAVSGLVIDRAPASGVPNAGLSDRD